MCVYLLVVPLLHNPARQYGVSPEQAAEVSHLHILFAESHVSAAVLPVPHVDAVPHMHVPSTHVSPDIHVTAAHGSTMI